MEKKILLPIVGFGLLLGLGGCANVSGPYAYQGAAAGGAIGAVAGALIDDHNRWRGAVIGSAIGGAMGAATSEIAARSARHSYNSNQPVYYPRYEDSHYHRDDFYSRR